jgi:uncharacterized protein (TIGR02145 family)
MKTTITTLCWILSVYFAIGQTSLKESVGSLSSDSEFVFTNNKNIGVFIDSRDGIEYSTIQIGNQIWMEENLSFESYDSWCYDEKKSNCSRYGRLYTFESAQNACPDGWHLPSADEWSQMIETFNKEREGKALSLEEKKNCFNSNLGGWRSKSGNFYNSKEIGYYWTSDIKSVDFAWYYYVNILSDQFHKNYHNIHMAFSVRCVKD